jgi:hypothetical protein
MKTLLSWVGFAGMKARRLAMWGVRALQQGVTQDSSDFPKMQFTCKTKGANKAQGRANEEK